MRTGGILIHYPSGRVIEPTLPPPVCPQESVVPFQEVNPASVEHYKNILDRIDKLRHLVVAGRVSGLILIASDPQSGHFLTDVGLSEDLDRSDLFGFIGVLETLKLEMTENATMAPSMSLDGEIFDPYDEA